VAMCEQSGVEWIDCQQQTAHLLSLGAKPVARDVFLQWVQMDVRKPTPQWRII